MAKLRLCFLILLSVFKFCFSDPDNSTANAFDLCALEPLDPKEGFVDSDSGLKFLWNFCSNKTASDHCTDSSAAVCVFKVDSKSGNVSNRAPNAGRKNDLKLKFEASGHYSLTLEGSTECSENSSNKVFTTNFDFFCNDNEEEQSPSKSVMLVKNNDPCNFNFFWHTSLACPVEDKLRDSSENDCVLQVPGFDRKLDLKALRDEKYYTVHSDDTKRHFELNICAPVKNGACPDGSPFCEISDKSTLLNQFSTKPKMTTTFDRLTENILLKYVSTNETVSFEIVCDMFANSPIVKLTGVEKQVVTFKVLTSRVCLFSPKPCSVKKGNGVYDISSLSTSTKDWVAYDQRPGFESLKYFISVCKPLPPASMAHSCPGVQTSVCQSTVNSQSSVSLASSESSDLKVNQEDGSLILNYADGGACNAKYNSSSQIIFRCNPVEKGPILSDVTGDCTYIFEWKTPVACLKTPSLETVQKCQVKDSMFGNTFDLLELYKSDKDYSIIRDSGITYDINVCGSSLKKCGKNENTSVCNRQKDGKTFVAAFANNETLTNMDGQIALDYSGEACGSGNQTFHTKILFKCDHKIERGQPEFVSEGPCQLYLLWKTTYACPPFEEVECTVQDKSGTLYDLSSLSLPNNNYELHTSGTDKFLINVCRSIVRQVDYNCPYHSSACEARIDLTTSQNWTFQNLGQVQQGPSFDENGRLVLEYPMGAMCKDITSSDTHLSTKIIFKCLSGRIESEPEFVEKIGCTYVFFWETDAACPVNERNFDKDMSGKNCKIRNPKSGHVFDLSHLKLNKNLETSDGKGNTISVNICAPLINNGSRSLLACGSTSGSCLIDSQGRTSNLGDFNTTLTWSSNEELTLKYATLNSSNSRNETIIRFRCGPMRNETHVVFIERRSGTTFLDIFTSLACEHTVFCQAKSAGRSLSLFSMMDYRQNVETSVRAEPGNRVENFFFSVCKPLAEKQGLDCPSEAAVCSAQGSLEEGWKNTKSYGMAMTSPTFNSNGDVEIQYVNGSTCEEDPTQNYRSKITFKCKPGAFPGKPELDSKNAKKCEKNFIWPTMSVCLKRSGPQADTDCKMFHPILDQVIDLTKIQTNTGKKDFEIETADHIYYLQPCKSLSTKCKSAVCMSTKNSTKFTPMGKINSVIYGFDRNELILRYKSNVTCQDDAVYSTEIHFRCDDTTPKNDTSFNQPTLIEDLPCHPIFQWDTPVVCGVQSDLGFSAQANERKRTSSITGGVVFFFVIVVLCMGFLSLRTAENRERCRQKVNQLGHHTVTFCQSLGRRRRADDQRNLLGNRVNVPAFGSINDDDDVDLIMA